MSCCGGNCGCGSGCKCGSGCGGCKMYPDLVEVSASSNVANVTGVAPKISYVDGEMGMNGEEGGCPCGDNCKCDPCTCGK